MRHVRLGSTVAAAFLAALVGCSSARTLEESSSVPECARCHGFPPSAATGDPSHPAVASETTVCAVCHSATVAANGEIIPGGAHQNGHVDVTVAHPVPYPDHPVEALPKLASCTSCHGADYNGGTAPSCTACHAKPKDQGGAGASAWTTNCTFCHGTRTDGFAGTPVNLEAPPQPVNPADADAARKIGAHQTHLTDGTYAVALPCASCHQVPTTDQALTHFQGGGHPADIAFSPTAQKGVTGAAYANGTCNVYCHGSGTLVTGGANPTPAWTSTNLACNACHGLPPPSGPTFLAPNAHEFHLAQGVLCATCHQGYTNQSVDTATHVDGKKDVKIGGTTISGWDCVGCHDIVGTPPANHPAQFVALHTPVALAGIASCTGCHGANYDGGLNGGAPSCNACHAQIAASAPDWKTNCTWCHGTRTAGVTTATATAAPPQPVDANDPNAARKIGAHQAHLTSGPFANALPCSTCHTPPDTASALTHFSGNGTPATITFSPLAQQGVTGAAYNGTSCAVYCHGSGSSWPTGSNGANRTPAWTSTGLACDACHGTPPPTGPNVGTAPAHVFHVSTMGVPCSRCHNGYTSTSISPATHVDGTRDVIVVPTTGGTLRISGWNCTACHTALGV